MGDDKFSHVKIIAPTSVTVTLITIFILVRIFMCTKRITNFSDLMVYARSQKNEVYYIYVYVSSRVSDLSPSESDDDTIDNQNINRCRQGLAMVFMCVGLTEKKQL